MTWSRAELTELTELRSPTIEVQPALMAELMAHIIPVMEVLEKPKSRRLKTGQYL